MRPTHRIGGMQAFMLILAALCFDGLQLLIDLLALFPVVGVPLSFALGIVADLIAIFLFAIWFSHINVSLMARYPLSFLGTIVLENIPIVNIAPGWTWFVVTTIAKERARENASKEV